MKIIICDDEKNFLDILENKIKKIFTDTEITLLKFTDGNKVIKYMVEYMDVDIIFMDIWMNELNGFSVAKKIRDLDRFVRIVFISSTRSYATRGYEISATNYLVKPIQEKELKNCLDKVVKEIKQSSSFITENNDTGVYKILLNDIIYIDTYGRNTMIHTVSENIISRKSMKKQEERLNKNFVRCHSGYIVNMCFIKKYHVDKIELSNNEFIWVSKWRRKEFMITLARYYGELI